MRVVGEGKGSDKVVRRGGGVNRPVLCFAARKFGRMSEVWLWRQVTSIERLSSCVLTWEYVNRDIFPLEGLSFREIGDTNEPIVSGKWMSRLERACRRFTRNHYGVVGKERSRVRQLLEEIGPDVLLCQAGPVALRIMPVAEKLGIPMVVHFHGRDLSSALNEYWYRVSLAKCVRKFCHNVVVNHDQKELLLSWNVDRSRVSVIPCGAPIDKRGVEDSGRDPAKVRFIGVSRLVEKKGVAYTLQAFRSVLEQYPECELVLVGAGPARSELESMVLQLGIKDNVRFMGQVPNTTVHSLLQTSDVFVQHSIVAEDGNNEGSSVAVAEAAGCGLAIVATAGVGGMEDLVVHGETGFLVRQRNVQEMAERMMELAGNVELRRNFGEVGRQRVLERFDTRKQVGKLEEVLLACCGAAGSDPR